MTSVRAVDVKAVIEFAALMRQRMASSGRQGWEDPEKVTVEWLESQVLAQALDGQLLDSACYAMMAYFRGLGA